MKLILVLSVVAYGYAAKLDRTYLPPSNAATAGGSPGALTAPGTNAGFGQGLPNIPSGSADLGASFGQNNGIAKSPVAGNIQGPGRGQASGNFPGGVGFNSNIRDNEIQDTDAPSRPSFGQTNNFGSASQSRTPFGQSGQDFAQEARPERPQAAADRNAEILKYVNENNGDSYEYSYETSNGIAAGESGVATDGVKAQGGFSYTGDDGNSYSITYTADENGFQPQGEHLPTPHPIPEEILKSIEDNARAAAAGTQEGAYRPEEYESDSSATPYGGSAYNSPSQRPTSQGQGSSPFNQGPQDASAQGSFNGNSFNQANKPGQASSPFSASQTQQGAVNQYPQGTGSFNKDSYPEPSSQFKQSQQSVQGSGNVFGSPQGQSNQNNQGQNVQGPSDNGYNYNKPLSQGGRGPQQEQSPKFSQGFGNTNNGLSGQQAAQPTGPLNQSSRPSQGLNTQFENSRGPSNQFSPGQSQNGNGYNYNRPATPTQGSNQLSGQRNQQGQAPNSFPGSGSDNKVSSGLPTDQSIGQSNQKQRPIQNSVNQFGSQQAPNQYTSGQNGQGNGYDYNRPQSPTQGSKFPSSGSQQNTNNGVFGQQPGLPARESNQPQRPSSNSFGRPQEKEASNQFSQPQRGQNQEGNGYNYNQPQKPSQGSNQFSGFGTQGPAAQPGRGGMGNDLASPSGTQAGQSINSFGQPQRPVQGTPSGPRNQQSQSNQYSPKPNAQDQDENGYYYNRPQNGQGSFGLNRPTPNGQAAFGQNRPTSNGLSQSGSPSRPASNYDANNADSRPGQQGFSNMIQPSFSQTRPGSNGNAQPGSPSQGSQYSPDTKPFGSPNTESRPSNIGSTDGSRPNGSFQPSLSSASQFIPQQTSQNRPTPGSFGSRPSQSPSSQTLAQGYQYGSPDQTSNQPQRPGFNSQLNGAPAKSSPGSEFGGPRQPPSFSPEEGYKY